MTRVSQVEDVEEVLAKWTRLVKISRDDANLSSHDLLQLFLNSLRDGAVFFVYNDRGLAGFCCVGCENDAVILRSMPRDCGEGLAKSCLSAVIDWAKRSGYDRLMATTTNLNGSGGRYFGRHLGFNRFATVFKLDI